MAITTQTSDRSPNSSTPTVTLPANVAAGDLVLAFVMQDGSGTFTWPSPWVELVDETGTGFSSHIAYLVASGGETTVVPTSTISERSNHIAVRIPAAEWHGTTPPEVSASASGNDTNPDPPSLSPSWGAENTTWVAAIGTDDSAAPFPVTGWPTGYDSNQTQESTATSAADVAIAIKQATAASDDPSAFTIGKETWLAYTLAVRPPSGATIVTASTSVTGSGVVAAAGNVLRRVAATITGSGTVSPSATVIRGVATSVQGTGTVSPAAAGATSVDTTVTATGTVSPSASVIRGVATSISGAATNSPIGTVLRGVAATITAAGSVAAAAGRLVGISTSVSGTGSVTPSVAGATRNLPPKGTASMMGLGV